jgi:hypothetical protein
LPGKSAEFLGVRQLAAAFYISGPANLDSIPWTSSNRTTGSNTCWQKHFALSYLESTLVE